MKCRKEIAGQANFGNDLHYWVTLKEEGNEGKVLANIILLNKEGLEKYFLRRKRKTRVHSNIGNLLCGHSW